MPSYTCCTQLFGYFSVETSWSRRDMRLGTIFRSKSTTSASNGRGGILRPPRPRLSLQTPASDKVKSSKMRLYISSRGHFKQLWWVGWMYGSYLEVQLEHIAFLIKHCFGRGNRRCKGGQLGRITTLIENLSNCCLEYTCQYKV